MGEATGEGRGGDLCPAGVRQVGAAQHWLGPWTLPAFSGRHLHLDPGLLEHFRVLEPGKLWDSDQAGVSEDSRGWSPGDWEVHL